MPFCLPPIIAGARSPFLASLVATRAPIGPQSLHRRDLGTLPSGAIAAQTQTQLDPAVSYGAAGEVGRPFTPTVARERRLDPRVPCRVSVRSFSPSTVRGLGTLPMKAGQTGRFFLKWRRAGRRAPEPGGRTAEQVDRRKSLKAGSRASSSLGRLATARSASPGAYRPPAADVLRCRVGRPGLEPGANGLKGRCSTIELAPLTLRHNIVIVSRSPSERSQSPRAWPRLTGSWPFVSPGPLPSPPRCP